MNKSLNKSLLLFTVIIFLSQNLMSQRRANPIISPEVHQDKSVTFRFSAPLAKEVKLNTQILKEPVLMTKDTNGLWTITLESVTPDIYPYCFVADGISVSDPNNVNISPSERFKFSLVDITGETPLIHAMQDVPHGEITYCYYNSKTLGVNRPLVIYTPPGYKQNKSKKYPVLYLIHGSTDTEETWFKIGHVNLILDNLIAQGKAIPMIIVMPYANTSPQTGTLFTKDLINDIIPYTEKNYRVILKSEQRAVAGFSRGGGQTLNAGLLNSNMFAWVCAFSPSSNAEEFEKYFTDRSPDPIILNEQLKLLFLSCGKEDFLLDRVTGFVDLLKKYNIKHETFFPPGGHTWMNCRLYISTVAPMLFR